jgi:ABC-type transport system substrate-binding protein
MVFGLAVAGVSMVIPAHADGKRFSFTIMTNQGNLARISSAEIIQENLEDIGVEVDLRIVEWPTFVYQNLLGQDFDAVIVGWSGGYDPGFKSLFHSDHMDLFEYNFCGLNNSELDDLIEQSQGETNTTARQEQFYRMQEILAEQAPYDFLVYPQLLTAWGADWEGFIPAGYDTWAKNWWSIANITQNDGSDTLIQGSIGPPSTMLPIAVFDTASLEVSYPQYPALLYATPDITPRAYCCEKWIVNDGVDNYTNALAGGFWFYFELRDDLTWTDVQIVNATDYIFTYELLKAANDRHTILDSPNAENAEWIDEIYSPGDDPYKLNFTVNTADWPTGISAKAVWDVGLCIPEHVFNDTSESIWTSWAEVKAGLGVSDTDWAANGGDGSDYWRWRWVEDHINRHPQQIGTQTPVTCGFWKFVDWDVATNEVTLEKDDTWPLWSDAKNEDAIKTFIYRPGGTMDEISLNLQDGVIDYQTGVNPNYFDTLVDDPDVETNVTSMLSLTYMGYNMRRAPFDDIRVRQALNWAIDKVDVFDAAYAGYGEVATAMPYSSQAFWYNPDVEDYYPPNPDLAEELLDDAGYPRKAEGTDWAQVALITGIAAAAVIAIVVVYMVKIKGVEE